MAYGVFLASLGYLTSTTGTDNSMSILLGGVIGGGLCLLWGGLGMAGYQKRTGLGLTLSAVVFFMLVQTVHSWGDAGMQTARWYVVVALVMSIAMLMYTLHGDRPAEFYRG